MSFPWECFIQSVGEAELARSEDFDYLGLLGHHYSQFRPPPHAYFSGGIRVQSRSTAQTILDATEVLKGLTINNSRSVPDDAPKDFSVAAGRLTAIGAFARSTHTALMLLAGIDASFDFNFNDYLHSASLCPAPPYSATAPTLPTPHFQVGTFYLFRNHRVPVFGNRLRTHTNACPTSHRHPESVYRSSIGRSGTP